jgi:hypothetical protein
MIDFGAQKCFMAAAVSLECPANHFFTLTAGINVTGIKKIYTGIQRAVQHLG